MAECPESGSGSTVTVIEETSESPLVCTAYFIVLSKSFFLKSVRFTIIFKPLAQRIDSSVSCNLNEILGLDGFKVALKKLKLASC